MGEWPSQFDWTRRATPRHASPTTPRHAAEQKAAVKPWDKRGAASAAGGHRPRPPPALAVSAFGSETKKQKNKKYKNKSVGRVFRPAYRKFRLADTLIVFPSCAPGKSAVRSNFAHQRRVFHAVRPAVAPAEPEPQPSHTVTVALPARPRAEPHKHAGKSVIPKARKTRSSSKRHFVILIHFPIGPMHAESNVRDTG